MLLIRVALALLALYFVDTSVLISEISQIEIAICYCGPYVQSSLTREGDVFGFMVEQVKKYFRFGPVLSRPNTSTGEKSATSGSVVQDDLPLSLLHR